jgi:hypothetical protein
MIVFIYTVLVFLVLRFSVTLFNFLSNPKLNKYGKRFNDTVSILVSNPQDRDLSVLLNSVEKQDHKNLEVITIRNGEEERAAVRRAKGKYLLFLDDDFELKSGLINNLIYRTKVFDLSCLNLMPNAKPANLYEWCTVPLNDFLILNLFPLRLVRLTGSTGFATGNTGCAFWKAEAYKHDSPPERVETLLANGLLYSSPNRQFVPNHSLLPTFGENIIAALIYFLLVIVGPIVMFLYFDPVLAALPLGLIFLSKVMISFLTKQNPFLNVILHPIQMGFLAFILIRDIWKKLLHFIK